MTEQEIREAVQALVNEMNFRLLCEAGEADLFLDTILWVTGITVTEIVYPKQKKSIFSRIRALLRRGIQRLKSLFVRDAHTARS